MNRLLLVALTATTFHVAQALNYPHTTAEPQKTGWPLTDEEKAYVLKPEHERRPGKEQNQHLPAMWPVTPSAGNWGGTSWLDTHAGLVKTVEANKGPVDVLLVGDSITMQWGAAWTKHFPTLKTVNIGIGGDKTQNVLWRLDHGGVAGIEPRLIVLLIGNNNMFFTAETGIEAAAQGIKMCAANLREKFPNVRIIVAKILPAHAPGVRFYEDIKKTNVALDSLKLDSDPKVAVLDLWSDFTNPDGSLKKDLFAPDNIHLSPAGYAVYAKRLKPLFDRFLGGKEQSVPVSAAGAAPEPVRQRVVELPLRGYQVWPSQPPKDCPFEQSKTLAGIVFTGAHSDYHVGDTFYPSWAADGNQYSPFTDGVTDGVGSFSFGEKATTGNAVMMGDDPLNLKIKNTALPQVANPRPYEGRYPAGSLVHNGVWYYGTYCLGPSGTVKHEGFTYNWPVLGPMPGLRISKDFGKTWTPSPLSPDKPLFPEPEKFMGPVKMGAPHFVDFGKNMEHSADGKAYLLGMGAEESDTKPRYANLSWISADQVYLARVTPNPETINDLKAYEFFAGHGKDGKPVWTSDFAKIKPLLDWNNNMGCVTATYVPGLKKYLMCVTDGWPTCAKMNSYILEADQLTGPWRLVVYMKDFGEQAYFLNFPSKFISPDGKKLWLCYSANFAADWNGMKLKFNPPGGRYGLCLHEVRLLGPGEKVEQKANPFESPNNVARQAKVEANSTHPDYRAEGTIDGQAGGWPGDIKEEWASFGWGAGAYIKLTWEKPQTVSRVWLVDRPNPTDQVTGGTIEFSDGSSITLEHPLPDDGTKALEITFAPKTITSLTFKVTKVKQTPCNIGLSEISVFASSGSKY